MTGPRIAVDFEATASRPAAGWSTDPEGHPVFVRHGSSVMAGAPDLAGHEPYFVGVHGDDYTRWVYRPVEAARSELPTDLVEFLWPGQTAAPTTLEEFLRELHVPPLNDDGLQNLVRLAVLRLAEHGHWRAEESPVGASREIVWRAAQDISNQFGWFDGLFGAEADRA